MSFVPAGSQKLPAVLDHVAAACAPGGHPPTWATASAARQTADLAGQTAAGTDTSTALLIGPAATVVVAVIGWLLYAWYRRRDHRRANLTETSETLGKVDLEVRRLTALHRALTAADFATLDDLLLHVQRAAARCGQRRRLRSLQTRLSRVADAIVQYTGSASMSCTAVAQAHVDATVITDVTPSLEMALFVRAVQQQVRVAEQLATAVTAAENRLEKLRAS
ncbi:hypothetical protein ACFW20_30280 [Streptomyces nigra]|uniref:hypothetical protein n=2 Tax=Streptomyces nigra TaxID=1827580 RepID=UPI0036363300